MKSVFRLSLLWILLGCGCYRPETRTYVLEIPEAAGNPGELDAIKRFLLGEQDQLREGLAFYEVIRVQPETSSLAVTYNREYLADMNLVHKINQLGYSVHDLPGDPEKRVAFLKQMNHP